MMKFKFCQFRQRIGTSTFCGTLFVALFAGATPALASASFASLPADTHFLVQHCLDAASFAQASRVNSSWYMTARGALPRPGDWLTIQVHCPLAYLPRDKKFVALIDTLNDQQLVSLAQATLSRLEETSAAAAADPALHYLASLYTVDSLVNAISAKAALQGRAFVRGQDHKEPTVRALAGGELRQAADALTANSSALTYATPLPRHQDRRLRPAIARVEAWPKAWSLARQKTDELASTGLDAVLRTSMREAIAAGESQGDSAAKLAATIEHTAVVALVTHSGAFWRAVYTPTYQYLTDHQDQGEHAGNDPLREHLAGESNEQPAYTLRASVFAPLQAAAKRLTAPIDAVEAADPASR